MSPPRLELLAPSLAATHAVAAALAGIARRGDVVLLAGEMGAGKTAFAQGFGRALGVTEPITSPTFTLVHTYQTGGTALHHADLYRLDHLAEVADLALGELAEEDGIVLVEWGDVVDSTFGDHLVVRLETLDDDSEARSLTITPVGRSWAPRWDRLQTACRAALGASGVAAGQARPGGSERPGGPARPEAPC